MFSKNNKPSKDKNTLNGITSINDLKEMESNDKELTPQQYLALKNYDRYRVRELNKQKTEENFHKTYLQLQAIANLTSFEDFLKEEYF